MALCGGRSHSIARPEGALATKGTQEDDESVIQLSSIVASK